MKKVSFTALAGIGFVTILAAVFIINLIIPDKDFSSEENRMLQTRPSFSVSNYMEGRFEAKQESYADDQFLLRNFFIKTKAAADVTMGKLESNGVYRCRDNYLMEGLNAPKDSMYKELITSLSDFREKNRNLKMYFLAAPNAGNILSSKLPATVRLNDQNKYMDRFFSDIESLGYQPVDVRSDFIKRAEDTQLYYRTDHHWTTDGAYIAFKNAAKTMHLKTDVSYKPFVVKTDFRGTLSSKSGFSNGQNDAIKIYMPKKDKDYKNSVIYYADTKEKTTQFYQLDNLKTKDAYTVFGGSNHPLYTIETPTINDDKLLIIKDSYANSFIPFIVQDYRKVVIVDPRYYFGNIENLIKSENISQVLFLYNANTLFTDDSLSIMI